MKRILLLPFAVMWCLVGFAQERVVSGKVTSQEDGSAIPGVNVIIKGTTIGTVTDADGMYRISFTGNENTLVFSFIGFLTQEVNLGERSIVDVSLNQDVTQLSEVVVTSLGIERESRELGYSISGVKSEDLVVARETNILNSLQGKVTGVNITQSSGNLGGSTKIVIRGITSLSGRNNPLWVVDGIPINDAQDASGSRITGNRDFANGAAVINPDDVESLNVLKGAAATALYGSRGAAGVIVVTTKKGKASDSGQPSVSINSSVRFDDLFRIPNFQNSFSQGFYNKYDSSSFSNWGARIAGQLVTESITNNTVPLRAYPDNYKEFYRMGRTMINNISVSDANSKGDYRLSVTSLNQQGILPNAALDRLTFSLGAGMKHSEKLKSRFSVQYINTGSQGTGVAGANDPNVLGVNIFTNTIDYRKYKPWIDELGNQINTVALTDNNPFWIQFENKNERNDYRFIGNFETSFSPVQELSITGRFGYDYDIDNRLITNRVGTRSRAAGDFRIDNLNRTQFNIDVIATYFKSLATDLDLKVLAGYNFNRRFFRRETLFSEGLSIPELFNPSNALTNTPTRGFSEYILLGAYSEVGLSFKDWATLTLTARNDWSSTLPQNNRSYFYPSASLAVVLTDALNLESNFLSYAKLRLSASQVGNDTDPYQLDFQYFAVSQATGQYSLNQNFPFDGRLGFQASNTIPPVSLKPEQQTSYEVGAELRLFNGRLGLDVAYFNSSNKNQILAVPIPQSSGFSFKTLNVGEIVTNGFELTLDADIIRTNSFKWNTIVNFTTTEATVKSLAQGTERIVIASEFNSIQVVAVPNRELQLFAVPYLRDSITGRPIINPTNGLRQAGEARLFGTVFPDFIAGITNQFRFKGITLSATVDMKFGGLLSSSTVGGLWSGGYVEETTRNRQGTYIDKEGVLLNTDGSTRENDIPVRSVQDFWGGLFANSIAEAQIFDASFVKLREIGISYNIPRAILGNGFIKDIQVGVEGRNLALLYSKVPHIDPEANLFGSGVDGFGSERNSTPSTRSIGFNVRLKF